MSRCTSQCDLVPVHELLSITVAPGAIICYLGNYCPAVEALGLVANLRAPKSPPRPPGQLKQRRRRPGSPLTSGFIPATLFSSISCRHTPSVQGWTSAPRRSKRGSCLELWGGSCHPAVASQHQTELSVTFPDKLTPIPHSRQAGEMGYKIEPLSARN